MNIRDMIGWWKLDEPNGTVAIDSSNHSNHGTYINTPPHNQGVFSNSKAVYLQGINSYISIPTIGQVSTGPFSWSVWTQYLGSLSTSNTYVLGNTSSSSAISIESIAINVKAGGFWKSFDVGKAIVRTNWCHIIVTLDTNGVLLCYFNGIKLATSYNSISGSNPINQIGRYGSSCYYGVIDDVRIYNRTLTDEEAWLLFNWNEDIHTDILTTSVNNGDVYSSEGTISVPNTGIARFASVGNINITALQNIATSTPRQQFTLYNIL